MLPKNVITEINTTVNLFGVKQNWAETMFLQAFFFFLDWHENNRLHFTVTSVSPRGEIYGRKDTFPALQTIVTCVKMPILSLRDVEIPVKHLTHLEHLVNSHHLKKKKPNNNNKKKTTVIHHNSLQLNQKFIPLMVIWSTEDPKLHHGLVSTRVCSVIMCMAQTGLLTQVTTQHINTNW